MIALAVLYFINPAVTSALGARFAELATALGLSPGGFAIGLVGQTVGLTAVILAVAPRLADRYGARATARTAALAYCLVTPLVAVVGSLGGLFVAFLLSGAVNALLDLSQTRLATAAERQSGRTLIPYLDIPAAIGSLVGTTAGASTAGRTGLPSFAVVFCVACAVAVLAAWCFLPRPRPLPISELPTARAVPLAGLCALAGAGLALHLAVLDWATLVFQQIGSPVTQYGLGNLTFVCGVTVSLLFCGRLADRHGRTIVLRSAAVLGIAAMVAATLASTPTTLAVSLGLAGVGLAPAHPLALSAAGVGSSRDQARVIAASYIGIVVARPIVGALSPLLGVQASLGVLTIALCTVVFGVAGAARGRRPLER